MNVEIKSGRSKENWCKSTQRYYGLSWKIEENLTQIVEFTNILNFLPPDYFVTSKTTFSLFALPTTNTCSTK
jgi:hypothetical protein